MHGHNKATADFDGRMIFLSQLAVVSAPLSFGALVWKTDVARGPRVWVKTRRWQRIKNLKVLKISLHLTLIVLCSLLTRPQTAAKLPRDHTHHGNLLRHWPWICNPLGELWYGGAVHKGSVTHLPRWMFRSILGSATYRQHRPAQSLQRCCLNCQRIPLSTTCTKDSQLCVQHVCCSTVPKLC
mgnify:CR=1 FL=1